MQLTYVGPHDAVEIAATSQVVERGGVVDVTVELAGRAPAGDDPGDGLLAQPSNWQPTPTKAAKAAKEGDSE